MSAAGPTPVSAGDPGLDPAPAPAAPAPAPAPGSFALVAVFVALSVFLTHGFVTMDVTDIGDGPGPRFVPGILLAAAWAVTVALAVDALRSRRRPAPQTPQERPTATDWRAVAAVGATFALFIAALVPLGWLLAGTFLFWGVAQAMGSRRRLFDLGVGLAVASVVQLAFSAGLGLTLPSGILGAF